MEYIAPSTRPKEALSNAARLMQLAYGLTVTDRPHWIARARKESAKLSNHYAEGSHRLSTASNDEMRNHITHLRNELRLAEIRLNQQVIAFTPKITPVPHLSNTYQASRVIGKATEFWIKGLVLVIGLVAVFGIVSAAKSFFSSGTNQRNPPIQAAAALPTTRQSISTQIEVTSPTCTPADLTFLQAYNPITKLLTDDMTVINTMSRYRVTSVNSLTQNMRLKAATKRFGEFRLHIFQANTLSPSPRFVETHEQDMEALNYYATAFDTWISTLSTTGSAPGMSDTYNAVNQQLTSTKRAICYS